MISLDYTDYRMECGNCKLVDPCQMLQFTKCKQNTIKTYSVLFIYSIICRHVKKIFNVQLLHCYYHQSTHFLEIQIPRYLESKCPGKHSSRLIASIRNKHFFLPTCCNLNHQNERNILQKLYIIKVFCCIVQKTGDRCYKNGKLNGN